MRFNYTLFQRSCMCMLLLLLSQFNIALAQNEKKISGTVVDSKNLPIPGVSIFVKGTTKSTSSGADGTFSITAKTGDIIAFSFIGFDVKNVTVTNATTYKVTLTEGATMLSDVVVVGYGTSSRKALISSISSVKGEDLNKGAISDVGQLLQGKVPGLNISRSGDPNRNAAIVLRGASTLREGAQSPLYVIDGVPGADISLVAPEDIATIDVLKDAAAAAIYGNRAANGVIMITLKKGKSGQSVVNYSTYFGLEKVSNQYEMMDSDQLRAFLAKSGQALTPANDKGANTNWQDEVQRATAQSFNHNLSFSGGTEKNNL